MTLIDSQRSLLGNWESNDWASDFEIKKNTQFRIKGELTLKI